VPTTHSVPVYRTYTTSDKDEYGEYTETKTRLVRYENMTGMMEVAQIDMGKTTEGPTITYTGRATPSKASMAKSGGGSGSRKKNSDVERYHEIKSTRKDLQTEYDRLEKQKGRSVGNGYIQYNQAQRQKLQEMLAAT